MDEDTYQIRWTELAIEDYNEVVNYLLKNWPVKVAEDFIAKMERRIYILSGQPFIGIASEKKPMIRSIQITKHNRLYYRIVNNTIELLNLFDTRKDPEKNPY